MRGERSDTEVTCIPKDIQHCSGRSDKGSAVGILWATGGASWVGLGGKRAQNSPLCGRRPHSGSQTHMGPYDTGGYCKDV